MNNLNTITRMLEKIVPAADPRPVTILASAGFTGATIYTGLSYLGETERASHMVDKSAQHAAEGNLKGAAVFGCAAVGFALASIPNRSRE